MTEPRLKSELWIKAQLRQCDVAMTPAVISRRGDAQAGQVFIKRLRMDGTGDLLARRTTGDGVRVWAVVKEGAESELDAYLTREADIDPDFWVLEVEDPNSTYRPDGQDPIRFM